MSPYSRSSWLVLAAIAGCSGRCDRTEPRPAESVELGPGSFAMGSPSSEPCRGSDEARREVELTYRFALDRREVTQAMFAAQMGYNPSFRGECPSCPVDSVNQFEAAAFCNRRSEQEGRPACYACRGAELDLRCVETGPITACLGYRLPTEAEWEYAARAGTTTATYAGDLRSCMATDPGVGRIAWYKVNATGRTQPVGTREPNPWGLFDMAGNVYEWTADPYRASGPERVLRGGSWYHNAEHARAAHRHYAKPEKRLSYVGFRCARTLDHQDRRSGG
ncbi:MAG: SUMF1/EgtB/PvdO family nonheme iron enzyme [Myxococcota bacterium]